MPGAKQTKMKIKVTDGPLIKEFDGECVVSLKCAHAEFRVYINDDGGESITIIKIESENDQIQIKPVVGNKIEIS